MKRLIIGVLIAVCMLSMMGCTNAPVEGSEKTYCGTVVDCGMSVVKEGDRKGRSYIIIASDDNADICFWLGKDCENPAGIGDEVVVESAVEENTGLLTAIRITVQ